MSTTRTCIIGDATILLDLDTEAEPEGIRNYELWRASTYATKEPDTLAWIDTHFREGDILYDIGANIGQYSLYTARKLNANATIFAFEPEGLNFAKLNKNIALNSLSGVIIPYCLAVSDRTALERFYVKSFTPGASLHALGRPITQGEKPFDPQHQEGAMAVSIDDLTGRFGLPCPNHIKVDVDGIEDRIVAGAARTLTDPRLRTFLIEVFMIGDIAERIKTAFFHAGFLLSNETDVRYTPGTVQNLIFTRP